MSAQSGRASGEISITRVVGFSAAHRYHSDRLSDEENRHVFGKCNRPHGHGHNYRLEVTVSGAVDPVTGMVMNLADLDRILREVVVDRLDHSFLNHDIEHFATVVPTCENIVLWLVDQLDASGEQLVIIVAKDRHAGRVDHVVRINARTIRAIRFVVIANRIDAGVQAGSPGEAFFLGLAASQESAAGVLK